MNTTQSGRHALNCGHQRYGTIYDCLIISAIPILFAATNDTWLYPTIGWLDEWFYVGYGINYSDPEFLPGYYKISRLPWVLVEVMARNLFSPVTASWLMVLGCLTVGNVAFYAAIREALGRPPALLAAVFLAAFTPVHASGGADYHNTLAGPLYCVSLLLSTRAARSPGVTFDAFLSGVAIALMLHTNILFVNFLPILTLHYSVSYYARHNAIPPLFRSIGLTTVGAIAITVVLGVINAAVGRKFGFYEPILRLVTSFVADSSHQASWWHPWHTGWYWHIAYLGTYLAGMGAAAGCLVMALRKWRAGGQYLQIAAFSAAFLYTAILWLIWQCLGHTALDWAYFAYPLAFPFAGLVAAAIALFAPPALERRPYLAAASAAALALCLIAALRYGPTVRVYGQVLSSQAMLQATAGFTVAFGLLALGRVARFALLPAIPAFAIANALGTDAISHYEEAKCPVRRQAYEVAVHAHKDLRAIKTDVGYWFDRIYLFSDANETIPSCSGAKMRTEHFTASLTSTGFRFLAAPWDAKTLETVDIVRWREVARAHGIIGLITRNPARLGILQSAIRATGGSPKVMQSLTYVLADTPVTMHVVSVNGLDPAAAMLVRRRMKPKPFSCFPNVRGCAGLKTVRIWPLTRRVQPQAPLCPIQVRLGT